MDSLLILLGVGFMFWCLGEGIVRIIKAAKGNAGGSITRKVSELETDVASIEQDLEDARKRIEVLETIVTDDRHDLRRQIDDLAQ